MYGLRILTKRQIYIGKSSTPAYCYPSLTAISLGIILNEIVTRAKPYEQELDQYGESNYEAVFDRVKHHNLYPAMLSPDEDMYAGKVNEIIVSCLRRNPVARPSISQVKSRIKVIDPHITGSDNVVDNLAILVSTVLNQKETSQLMKGLIVGKIRK